MYSSLFRAVFGFAMFIAGAGFIPAYYMLRLSAERFSQVNWLKKYNDHFIITYPLMQLFLLMIVLVSGLTKQVWGWYVYVTGWDEFLLFFASVWGLTSVFFLIPRFRRVDKLVIWHNAVFVLALTAMITTMASPAFLESSDFILSYLGALAFSIAFYFDAALIVIAASWLSKKLSHRLNHARLT